MIVFLKKAALRSHLIFKPSFCYGSKDKSNKEFYKAVLASKIITIIKESPFNDSISRSFPSLKDNILNEIQNYENQAIQHKQDVRKASQQLRNCFENGVYVPLYMCNQNKNIQKVVLFNEIRLKSQVQQKELQSSEQKIANNSQIEVLNVEETSEKILKELRFRKLNFVPTYLITGQIFRGIFMLENYTLLIKHDAVGKTYSSILYVLLSEIIFRYRHKYWKGEEDLRKLPKEINFDIPKAFYLSVNYVEQILNKDNLKNQISELLQLHFYEIKETLKNKGIFSPQISLDLIYQRDFGIRTKFLLDQINELASNLRKYNAISKKYRRIHAEMEQIYQKIKKNQYSQIQIQIQKIIKLQKLVKSQQLKLDTAEIPWRKSYDVMSKLRLLIGRRMFYSIIYLSSIDIEKDVLMLMELMGSSQIQYDWNFIYRLQYPVSLSTNISIADTIQMIIVNLQKYWEGYSALSKTPRQKIYENQKETIKKLKDCLSKIMRNHQYYLLLPVSISAYFDTIKKTGEVSKQLQQFSQEKIDNLDQPMLNVILSSLLENIQKRSIKEIQLKFSQFFTKKTGKKRIDNQKLSLFFMIWMNAQNIIKNFNSQLSKNQTQDSQKTKKISFFLERTQHIVSFDLFKLQYRHQQFDFMTETMFKFQKFELTIYCNPYVIRQIFNKNKQIYFEELYKGSEQLFNLMKSNASALRILLELLLIHIIVGRKRGFKIQKSLNYCFQTVKRFDSIYDPSSTFLPIPKSNSQQHKNFHFIKSFKDHLEVLKSDHDRKFSDNLLLPLRNEFSEKFAEIVQRGIARSQVDGDSKVIDFAICKEDKYSVEIDLFGVTISDNKVYDKIQQFLVEFDNFQDKNTKQIQINGCKKIVQINYNVIAYEKQNSNFAQHFSNKLEKLEKKMQKKKAEELKKKENAKVNLKDSTNLNKENCAEVTDKNNTNPNGENSTQAQIEDQANDDEENHKKLKTLIDKYVFTDVKGIYQVKVAEKQKEVCLQNIRIIQISKQELQFEKQFGDQRSNEQKFYDRLLKELKYAKIYKKRYEQLFD